jgi:hypothetical protein
MTTRIRRCCTFLSLSVRSPKPRIQGPAALQSPDAFAGVDVTAVERGLNEPSVSAPGDAQLARTDAGSVERTLAMLALVAMGPRFTFHFGISYGLLFAVLISPLWIGSFARFKLGRLAAGAVLATACWGFYLAKLSSATHQISTSEARIETVLLVGSLCMIGVVLWARTILSTSQIAICFGAGLLADAVLRPVATTNQWKFVFSVPVTIVVLGLAARSKKPWPSVAALVVLAGVSVLLDCRAYSTALLLAALLTVWRSMPRRADLRRSWVSTATMIGAVSFAIYLLGKTLLVDGYLGAAAQARSIEQINMSGSLILGGRPELQATLAMFSHNATGFGVGVVPSPADILVAKSGLRAINYAPDNGYVDHYMFGGQIELHSIAGDVWAQWGLPGLALVAGLALLAIRALAMSVAHRTGEPILIFVCCWTLWNIAFSPLVASRPVLVLAVAMCLLPRNPSRPRAAS